MGVAYPFGSLVFTPVIKALQERYGSRRQYAKREASSVGDAGLGPSEIEFLNECDSFYMATVGATGWPYVQHRGGPRGFLKVIDEHTISFTDYPGNKQFITTGNLMTDDRVALILVDYPRQARLKILGRVKISEGEFVIHVEAYDWNCQQYITPRFTEEQIKAALAPVEEEMRQLKEENARLKAANIR